MSISEVALMISVIVGVLSIISFILTRQDNAKKDMKDFTTTENDIRYIRDTLDDTRLDIKDMARKQNEQAERVIRLEENQKNMDERIKKIEREHTNG